MPNFSTWKKKNPKLFRHDAMIENNTHATRPTVVAWTWALLFEDKEEKMKAKNTKCTPEKQYDVQNSIFGCKFEPD